MIARVTRRKLALLAEARALNTELGFPFGDRDDLAGFLDTDPADLSLSDIKAALGELRMRARFVAHQRADPHCSCNDCLQDIGPIEDRGLMLPLADARHPDHGPLIGGFRNEWRRRDVAIYDHPSDPLLVVTCGRSIAAPPAPDVWTIESRADFARYIGTYHQVFR